MKTYHGGCHCGRIRFRIAADLSQLVRCTCSMCTKKAMLGCYVSAEHFELLQGESDLSLYQFNKKIAKHYFCRMCGIHSFMRPRSNPAAYAVNARCLDDFDLDTASYEVKLFDGRNWEAAQEARLNSGEAAQEARLKAQRGEA